MLDPHQVRAYANADFEGPHSAMIEILKSSFPDKTVTGNLLDLGCGAGDITFRIAREFKEINIDAVDGSEAMIRYAGELLEQNHDISDRIRFHRSMIHDFVSDRQYSFIVSNSLLHHLHDPMVLWEVIKNNAVNGTSVFIMDLRRPDGFEEAMKLVKKYAGNEPDVLKKDFFNSLIASFEPHEIRKQLITAGMSDFSVAEIGDRHQVIYGTFVSGITGRFSYNKY